MSDDAKPRKRVKTVGDLRSVLAQAIEEVAAGEMDLNTANTIVKLAGQMNASLLAEVEAARFTLACDNTYRALGALPLDAPLDDTVRIKGALPA